MDSGSLFHFLHHRGIGNFWRFISISYTVTRRFSRYSAKWLTSNKVMNPQHFDSNPAYIWIWIRINSEIWMRILDHFWLRFWPWRRLCSLSAPSSVNDESVSYKPLFKITTMQNVSSKETEANRPAGGLNGAALNGSAADKSVLDITRSSRLFTPEIPAGRTPMYLPPIWDHTSNYFNWTLYSRTYLSRYRLTG